MRAILIAAALLLAGCGVPEDVCIPVFSSPGCEDVRAGR